MRGKDRSTAGDYATAVALAAAGTGLAMLCVYLGTGLLDGFGGRDLSRVASRFRGYLPHAIAGSLAAGLALRFYHARLLAHTAPAWTLLVTLPRAFAHFPLYGMIALLGYVAAFAWGAVLLLATLLGLRPRDVPIGKAPSQRALLLSGIGVPLWFIVFPFDRAGGEGESNFPRPSPLTLQRRMLWLLPWLLAAVALFAGAESEDTGKRIAPELLAAAASFWLGDYLIVALQSAPVLRKHALAARWRETTAEADGE